MSQLRSLSTKIVLAVATLALLALPLVLMAKEPEVKTHQHFGVTSEGWWIIFTDSQVQVADMCSEPDNKTIVGCSRWPVMDPDVYPTKHCLVGVYTGDPDESVDEITEHELKHCRTGAYHDDLGRDIPNYTPRHEIPKDARGR